jgi:hypothetical protein
MLRFDRRSGAEVMSGVAEEPASEARVDRRW